jgi:phage major head subunit gpT-like protein
MTISGNVPQHLVVAARTGFLAAAMPAVPAYDAIARTIPMDAKSLDLVDLGDSPMPVESKGRTQRRAYIEKLLTVKPKDWEITVGLSHNAMKDDQTGQLESKVRSAGENFQLHISNRAFQALNDGDATTNFGAGYDGLAFYHDSHVDKGADYSTGQDNKYALTLSLDNFETVKVAAAKYRNDQGELVGYTHNLLVVAPELERTAAQITGNPNAYDTANRETNPYAGNTRYVVSAQFDSTAWTLVSAGLTIKPILIVMREAPNLQAAWFDPDAGDGGMYWFKFYARYNHYYGNWRLAVQGNT